MASTEFGENESTVRKMDPIDPGEEIVISGIAGRFPDSDNMKHFQENLFNKVDLVTSDDRRWRLDHQEIPQRTGKINNIDKFDADFFGINFKQAHSMDPMARMLLEHAYEAIIDAGCIPEDLRGTNTGVFVGTSYSESEKIWIYDNNESNGLGLTGCTKALMATRISYWLGINGPSYNVDTACSSSLVAMEQAYRAIRGGHCDAALVAGSNLCLHPFVSLQFARLGVLSPDGACKSFDADANGYTRSETIAVVYLQKAKDAKRVYATFVHAKTNCDGFKEEGITFPSSIMQSVLLQEFYQECGISPANLNFVEAHGTGTKVGDPEEVNAIDKAICKHRTTPLKIGAIKSNIGHSEPASGLCSIAKIIIAMESGIIPPNLHYNTPREELTAIKEGRIQVISEPTPWECGYVGINSFGFGGANCHLLLKSNSKEKVNNGAPKDDLPRLIVVSGRTIEAVATIFEDIESRPVDTEYVKLLHDLHSKNIIGHLYRGYSILQPHGITENSIKEIEYCPRTKRSVWFVFSGIGSHCLGMGIGLLRLPVFTKAVMKCDAVLKPRGIDIFDILTNTGQTTFNNILHSFVGITVVQIGLVDLLSTAGIIPDKIIGHSIGELGCAYADGCFTAEQTILAAYSLGKACLESKVTLGTMAIVELGHKDLKGKCSPDIEIVCHNGPNSATISGTAESMKNFLNKLQADNIYAKEIPCSNVPCHSQYMASIGPKLLAYLKEVIPNPNLRSPKWLSSSVPRAQWNVEVAKYSSAEYHTNNFLNTVLFEETFALIPKDAVTIEIAPQGILQTIFGKSLNREITNVALLQSGHRNDVEVVFQALGKLYNAGLQPQIMKLYPEVPYPVSRGTQMISPLIKWNHNEKWFVTLYKTIKRMVSGERVVGATLAEESYEYMAGHVIDGRNLIPATGYLQMIWETLGMMSGEFFSEIPVVFEDVKFLRATNITTSGIVNLTLMIQKGTGRFEVADGDAAVVTGFIRAVQNPAEERLSVPLTAEHDESEETLTTKDIYKELRLRGYQYNGLFRGLKSASSRGTKGHIAWTDNWVAFMDNMLQMQLLGLDSRGLFVPTGIRKLVIDTKVQLNKLREMDANEKQFPVYVDSELDCIVSGGVEIRGLNASVINRRKLAGNPVLEQYQFVAHMDRAEVSLRDFVRISCNLGLENLLGIRIKSVEVVDKSDKLDVEDLISVHIHEYLSDVPLIQADISVVTSATVEENTLPPNVAVMEPKKLGTDTNAQLAIGRHLLTKEKSDSLKLVISAIKDGGFILSREDLEDTNPKESVRGLNVDVIMEKKSGNELLVLLRKKDKIAKNAVVIHVNNADFAWVAEMQEAIKKITEENTGNTRIIVVGYGDFECGLLGLVNCLRREPGGELIRGMFIQDPKAPPFSLQNPLYADQYQLNLTLNVLGKDGTWGTYRHLPLKPLEMIPVHHATISQQVRGDMSTLYWLEGQISPETKNVVRVFYSSLNFRDVMLATGRLAIELIEKSRQAQECVIGLEYSGIDSSGQKVMGIVQNRALGNLILSDKSLTWNVPDNWSLEDAATVPVAYATCYYAFYFYGKLKKGDKVLIHAGSGGVGQAAINLALYEGCEVFTTVGTPEKRTFIREKFPTIPESHIGNSRDTSFEQLILQETNGRGVDIVLNSLAEEKLQASLRCLAKGGRFLEIGKFDLAANNSLGMEIFQREISFHGVMLDNMIDSPIDEQLTLKNIVSKGLLNGAIKPLTRTVFPKEEVEQAFRYMAAGKHIGKCMIKIRDESDPINAPILAYPRYHCLDDHSYVILGGLGGFGLELADWLVLKGAKKLVLVSRQGVKDGYQKMRIEIWEGYGVKVVIVSERDASKKEDCEFILKTAANLGPVDGIFNLAVVLKDCLLPNQSVETFEECFRGKAWSTKQLDEVSRKICPDLRHFVVFSSASCGRGNAGQTNYGMANSVMERICERRASEGLPALAIQWGAVGDVGLVAEMQVGPKEIVIAGTLPQKISSCLQELNRFLLQKHPVVSSYVVAAKRLGGAGATTIVGTVLNIMGLKSLKAIGHHTPLTELGMDSMMAVEIKQTLEREFDVFLTAQDIRSLNFAKLIEMDSEGEKRRQGDQNAETLTGMKLLIQCIGVEGISEDVCLKLETKNEVDRAEVFLVPGIEGYGTIFSSLAPRIKSPCTCLQFGINDLSQKGVLPITENLLPHFLMKNKGRKDFVIVGYSFGALVAIELVRMLEADGFTGRLVLLDGSPDQMKAIKDNQLASKTDEELQNNILLGLMDMFSPSTSPHLLLDLEKCKGWEDKLDAFMTRIKSDVKEDENVNMPDEDRRIICTGIYQRFIAVKEYDITDLPPIKAPIILLKPNIPMIRGIDEDYGLAKVTSGKIEIHYVEGNHLTMLQSNKVEAAIDGDSLEDVQVTSITEDGKTLASDNTTDKATSKTTDEVPDKANDVAKAKSANEDSGKS